ncbi:hypothetical protein P8C59_009240 [Phyllachora maydis]|uniref:Major facilitator superfamily (MFS) profile domain-containing protein n=1 Tax=Phyllachora maydis TaxID=1825666 RepID=A0AAD9IC76_9PEZI|nr:hypothetical protein P8C59_009240 [Phyllachora maydis]
MSAQGQATSAAAAAGLGQHSPVAASTRKRVLRVVFISLLLDLISFTFILPLFPSLLEFYRNSEATAGGAESKTLLASILGYLNAYKAAFARPIDSRYDIVLLGGALGSLFSLLQAVASPVIGHLSDCYGRRTALLASMAGNVLSVLLWVMAVDFRTFLASRVVGGLSEGNVQLATAIATDISDEGSRGATMALIGACFSIAFTFGPALGAFLSTISLVAANPFAAAAAVSLLLIVTETIFLYVCLPETLPALTRKTEDATKKTPPPPPPQQQQQHPNGTGAAPPVAPPVQRTNAHVLLNLVHMTFLLFFSGMEFSLPFMTYDLFGYSAAQNGRLLGYVGLVASVLQGGVTRRLPPLLSVRVGVVACLVAFALLSRLSTVPALYAAATGLAVTSATVVTGLNALSSFEAGEAERGGKLGVLRSWGQLGRGLGPVLFTTVYWWAGREVAYGLGAAGMLAVASLVFLQLQTPLGAERRRVNGEAKKEL